MLNIENKAIYLIVAMTNNRVIGKGEKLPWRISDELKKFKEITYGNTIIMGRKTFQSIGRPLPGRQNIVVSNTLCITDGIFIASSIGQAINISTSPKVFFIGGRDIYLQTLSIAQYMYISVIKSEYDGDIYFPELEMNEWVETECYEYDEFCLKHYKRVL